MSCCSSVGLLETRSGSLTAEFLGLATSRVSNKKGLIVLEQELLHFTLMGFVSEFLLEADNSLADCLADGQDLGSGTTTTDTDADV